MSNILIISSYTPCKKLLLCDPPNAVKSGLRPTNHVKKNMDSVVLCVGIIVLPARYIPSPSTVMQLPSRGSQRVMLFMEIERCLCGQTRLFRFRLISHGMTQSGVNEMVYHPLRLHIPEVDTPGLLYLTQARQPKVESSETNESFNVSSAVVNVNFPSRSVPSVSIRPASSSSLWSMEAVKYSSGMNLSERCLL